MMKLIPRKIKFWGPFKDFMKITSPNNYRLYGIHACVYSIIYAVYYLHVLYFLHRTFPRLVGGE